MVLSNCPADAVKDGLDVGRGDSDLVASADCKLLNDNSVKLETKGNCR